jgi:hypothetical protein
MRKLLVAATVLSATSVLPAQTFYSPPGAEHVQGNSGSAVSFGSTVGYQSRTQQADGNFVGHPLFRVCRSIAWRRYVSTGAGAVARIAEVTLIMAHTDYNTFGATFASNYKDTPVTVFAKKNVNLPDWSMLLTKLPAPWDLVIPFDVPWIYNANDALVWEKIITNTSAAGTYYPDWFSVAAALDWGQTHIDQGPGCTTANGVFNKHDVHRSDTTNLQVGFDITAGPSNAAVIVLIGRKLQTVGVPGLCAPLGTDILLTLIAGVTDGSGNLAANYVNIPWQQDFSWLLLTSQAVAPDPTQPGIQAVLSNATHYSLPKTAGVPGINCKRTYVQNSSTGTVGITPTVSSMPTRFSF